MCIRDSYCALEIAAAGRPIDGDYDRQTGSADDAVRFKSESGLGTPNTYTIITDIACLLYTSRCV